MAIYHLSIKTVARSKGQSATAAAAYRAAAKIEDERTGDTHDYTRKKGVIETALVLPNGIKMERAEIWNAAEAAETRKNSTVAREYELALPAELTARERSQLVKDFAGWLVEEYGVAADVAIHEPNKKGNDLNHHAHILTTTRTISRRGLGEKTRALDDRKSGEVEKIREKWETLCNQELHQFFGLGADGRREISRKSLRDQGVDRQPQIHVGVAAMGMERRGKKSERYRRNQAIKDLPAYKAQLAALQEGLAAATISPLAAAEMPQKAPKLEIEAPISVTEAHALINTSLAQIEDKMLLEYNTQRQAERKKIDEHISRCWAEHSSAEKEKPEKNFFERQHTFDERIKAWEEKCKKLRFKALDEAEIRNTFDQETWNGNRRVKSEARKVAEKAHPEAAAVLKKDEERKEAERQRWQEERQQQREQSRGRGGISR